MPITSACVNSVFEPVVKSCSRVPMASTQSASCASAFAAGEPVTPIAPVLSGSFQASAPLPACVSATGTPWASANACSASVAWPYSTPPPATIIGRLACRKRSTAALISSATRRGRMKVDHARFEELSREIPRRGLHVLRQGERHGSAQRRIGQHAQRARQRRQQLRGMHDAVEIARYGLERVVGGNAAVVKVLDLLQNRIRRARDEDVAGQQQHRQTVHMRERCSGQQIGRAGANGGRDRHHPAPEMRLRIGNRTMCHGLFVMRAQRRQFMTMLIQRFADARDVAVSEDREHAAEQRFGAGAVLGPDALRREVADQRLRRGKPQRARGRRARWRRGASGVEEVS